MDIKFSKFKLEKYSVSLKMNLGIYMQMIHYYTFIGQLHSMSHVFKTILQKCFSCFPHETQFCSFGVVLNHPLDFPCIYFLHYFDRPMSNGLKCVLHIEHLCFQMHTKTTTNLWWKRCFVDINTIYFSQVSKRVFLYIWSVTMG